MNIKYIIWYSYVKFSYLFIKESSNEEMENQFWLYSTQNQNQLIKLKNTTTTFTLSAEDKDQVCKTFFIIMKYSSDKVYLIEVVIHL